VYLNVRYAAARDQWDMTYHQGKSLGPDFERKNLQGVCHNQGSIRDIVEEVEDKDQRNGGWGKGISKRLAVKGGILTEPSCFVPLLTQRGGNRPCSEC